MRETSLDPATDAPLDFATMIAGHRRRRPTFSTTVVALAILLVAAAGARFYQLDWDNGNDLHPDEMYIAKQVLINRIAVDWPPDLGNLLDPARSGLNPRSVDPESGEYREFPYGALPLLTTDTLGALWSAVSGVDWNAPERVYLIGRSLSALLDTATVLVVFALGSRVYDRRVGLLAATFAALAPISIQLAHFFTTDSWLTFFVALCLLAAVRAAERGEGRWFAATGICFGLAMATKGSVFTLAGVIAAALLYVAWRWLRDGVAAALVGRRIVGRLGVAGGSALAAFALFEPYALLRPAPYLQSLATQADIVRGEYDVPFTRIYVGTTPVLYQAEQLVRWGFGPAAGVLAVAGGAVLLGQFWRQRTAGQWVLVAWLLGYGAVVAVAEAKFLRYLAPLVPVLCVLAGLALATLWGAIARRWGPRPAAFVGGALVAGAALWTAAFLGVYAEDHPRLAASRWIYANVADGSVLSAEVWDDSLPRSLGPGLDAAARRYEIVQFNSYHDRPPAESADELFALLRRVDYVVYSSNRVPDALARAPWRYPVHLRGLELLRDGGLGFEEAASFAVTPRVGPLALDDRWADESFVNYDHPRVTIYRKTAQISRGTFDAAMAPALARPWSATRQQPPADLLLDRPVGELPTVDDARWSAAVTGNSAAALGVWVLLLVVLQVAAWPLASFLFRGFGDGGWGASRLVGVLAGGYLTWLGASLEVVAFRAVWCWAAIALVAGLGWLAWHRRRRSGPAWRFEPGQWRVATGAEVVFWGVFALFLLFRLLNPDGWHPVWGGEKPMELAHLNATLRSAHFPPYDPWFAQGYVNYYYYGLYLVAFCLKLTGIPSEIGFNLAQPTVIALLASVGYTTAATLGRDIARRRVSPIASGLFGVLLLVGIGSLGGLRQLLEPGRPPLFSGDGFGHWVWDATRAISVGRQGYAITEFPFFTALYADLHAHVVALPMTVLAVALGYGITRDGIGGSRPVLGGRFAALALTVGGLFATNAWDVATYAALCGAALVTATAGLPWGRRLVTAGGATLLLGMLAYGSFLPFHERYVALFGSLARVAEPTAFGQMVSHLGGLLGIALIGVVVALLPNRGAVPWVVRSPWLVLVGVLCFSVRVVVGTSNPRLAVLLGAAVVALAAVAVAGAACAALGAERSGWARAAVGLGGALVALPLVLGWVSLAAFLVVGCGGVALWLLGRSVAARFVGLLLAAAGGVGAGTELVVVADNLIGGDWYRMNTVFKFYNQLWVLLALAGAALLGAQIDAVRGGSAGRALRGGPGAAIGIVPRGVAGRVERDRSAVARRELAPATVEPAAAARAGWAAVGLFVAAALIAASLIYPVTATAPRLAQRFGEGSVAWTLNANDWMRYGTVESRGPLGGEQLAFAEDRAVIDWFNRQVPGSPVVAEASIGQYRCNGSRIANGTGLPTIIGWQNHQSQQRPADGLEERLDDVGRLYRSDDPAEKATILRRYDVAYVVVGQLERRYPRGEDGCPATGSTAGIAAFDRMVGETIEVAFRQGSTVVYRVLPVGQELGS